MTSTFMGLEISKRGLVAQQTALNTVGHNISNANTPGYSRQVVNLAPTTAMDYPGINKSTSAGQIGTGVYAQSIDRVREGFLDAQYRDENKNSGEWQVRQDTLNKITAIFNEPSNTGISTVLNDFYNAWQALGRTPDSLEARSVVAQKAEDVATTVNTISAKLTQLDSDLSDNVTQTVNSFNQITSQITDLNKQITTLEVLGDKANDLRDQRDNLVDKLSNMANVTTSETNGVYTVSVGSTMVVNGANPPTQLTYDATTNTTSIPLTGGQIYGQMQSRSQYVGVYQDQLNSLINGMVQGNMQVQLPNDYTFPSSVTTMPFDATLPDGTQMKKGDPVTPGMTLKAGTTVTFAGLNGLHEFGFTNQSPTTQAGPLFTTKDGSTTFTAANLQVSQAIVDDVRNIASSDATYTDSAGKQQVKEGNGDVAFMIGESLNSVIDFKQGLPPNSAILTKGSTTDYIRAIVAQLGSQGQQANQSVTNEDALMQQIDGMRQSVSGVSIDEEMSNMIKFQQAYSASARVITTIDSMLDTVVNRMLT